MLAVFAFSLLLTAPAPVGLLAVQQEESEWIEEDTGWIEEEEAEPQGIPARGRGDFEFNLDSVSFLGPEGSTVQEGIHGSGMQDAGHRRRDL